MLVKMLAFQYGRICADKRSMGCLVLLFRLVPTLLLCGDFLFPAISGMAIGSRSGNAKQVSFSQNSVNDIPRLSVPSCKDHIIEELTISELQQLYHENSLTVTDVAGCYVRRIMQTIAYIKYV